jgi:hypothetical protein
MTYTTLPRCIRLRLARPLVPWRCPGCGDTMIAGGWIHLGGQWFKCSACWGHIHRREIHKGGVA